MGVALFAINSSNCIALSIALPKAFTVLSENAKYSAHILPVRLPKERMYSYYMEGSYLALFSETQPLVREDLVCWLSLAENHSAPNNYTKRIWERPLPGIISPQSLLVTDLGYVLVLGSWPGYLRKKEAGFSFYDFTGKLLCSYELSEIFTDEQLSFLISQTGNQGIWWSEISLTEKATYQTEEPFVGPGVDIYIIIHLKAPGVLNQLSPTRVMIQANGDGAGRLLQSGEIGNTSREAELR